MAIVCKQCGHRNPDGAGFCANPDCGAYLDWSGLQPTQPPTTERRLPDRQRGALAVTLSGDELTIEPGQTGTLTATIRNDGTRVEEFTVALLGPAADWCTAAPAAIQVYPGESADSVITFAPPRDSSVPPGRIRFLVRAASSLHPDVYTEVAGTVHVSPFRQLDATLSPQQSRGRGRTFHTVALTNTGNVAEHVRLSGTDPTGRMEFELPPGEVSVPPGEQRIGVRLRSPRVWLGRSRSYPFRLTAAARPPADEIRLDGTREAVPLIAGWVAKAAVAIAALAVAGAAFLMVNGSAESNLDDDPAALTEQSPGDGGEPTPATEASEEPSEESQDVADGGEETEDPGQGAPTPDPEPEPAEKYCLTYTPDTLSYFEVEPNIWLLTDGHNVEEHFYSEADAELAYQVAVRSSWLCNIGRDNDRPDWGGYVVTYWLGPGAEGVEGEPPTPDCVGYEPALLSVRQIPGEDGWELLAGDERLAKLDTEAEVQDALDVASHYTRMCYIGRANAPPETGWYVVRYWLP